MDSMWGSLFNLVFVYLNLKKIINTLLSITNQSLYKKVENTNDSAIDVKHNEESIKDINVSPTKRLPILKRRGKKRRSLSLPGVIIDENSKKVLNKRLNSTSSPLSGTCRSPCIIMSPIKPVQYLKTLFTNISNKGTKSKQLSPIVHKLRRPGIPFMTITPATPI